MGRFYFHLRAGDHVIPDEQGQDLPDVSAARREAIQPARGARGSTSAQVKSQPADLELGRSGGVNP
jgi:hypothetical protein